MNYMFYPVKSRIVIPAHSRMQVQYINSNNRVGAFQNGQIILSSSLLLHQNVNTHWPAIINVAVQKVIKKQ